MQNWTAARDLWANHPYFDAETHREVQALTEETEVRDRFGAMLEFGTAGLRGVMAAGTNRMNRYTVRLATRALCDWLQAKKKKAADRGLVIAYDSRHHSAEFAKETALTAAAAGVPVWLFPTLAPTPLLSFAVRRLGCGAGVVITASHNTREYNGYKAYDETGCQILPAEAEKIQHRMQALVLQEIVPAEEGAARAAGLLREVPQEILQAFEQAAAAVSFGLPPAAKAALQVVYTPLHGAGNVPVRQLLAAQGYEQVTVVPEQEKPDGDFPTVQAPNPEKVEALSLGIRLAAEQSADLVLATDPDSDRLAIAVQHKGLYQMLGGNRLGALLTEYLFERMPKAKHHRAVLVQTFVTGTLGAAIAEAYGATVRETPTGFKYIGQEITRMEKDPDHDFLLGYEESCGFLAGRHVRDKDGVSTALLVCEMAAYYKMQGQTLIDVLQSLYATYGFSLDAVDTIELPAVGAEEKRNAVMKTLRAKAELLTADLTKVCDYQKEIGTLPPVDLLKFFFADGSWMAVRPSGTEPKIKVYHEARQKDRARAEKILQTHRAALQAAIANI